MLRLAFLFLILLPILSFQTSYVQSQPQSSRSIPKTYKFFNGQWFDGKKFKRKTFYSVNGILTLQKPSKIDVELDLQKGYVVPPFADAHCHHFDGAYNVDQQVGIYLNDGIFYAKVQTDIRSGALEVAGKVNIPTSVDVSYSHGSLTHTFGHVFEVYEALALGIPPDARLIAANRDKLAASKARENDAYYIIDTLDDLENKWQKILDGKPDFIKIHLVTSDEYEEKNRNLSNIALRDIGLNPKIVPAIVERAHKSGLRVSAHVETISDYRIALKAGVDEMAHLPGYYIADNEKDELKTLTEEDAKETSRRGVWVIAAPIALDFEPAQRSRVDRILKQNLRLLKKYKVKFAFGSDRYGRTPLDDVLHISSLGVFTNLETLKIWSENTPKTIFPNRKIGQLCEGYEASFLVLNGNPIENFDRVKDIRLRLKQGILIMVAK